MRTTEKKQREFVLTPSEFGRLRSLGYIAIPATIHQTLGPNWRHIFYVSPDGSRAKRSRPHYYDVEERPESVYLKSRDLKETKTMEGSS